MYTGRTPVLARALAAALGLAAEPARAVLHIPPSDQRALCRPDPANRPVVRAHGAGSPFALVTEAIP